MNLYVTTPLALLLMLLASANWSPGIPVQRLSSHPAGDSAVFQSCLCAMDAGLLAITNCGANYPVNGNISVEYSSDAHSGTCDGPEPCVTATNCKGQVKVTAQSNAFTNFQPSPNPAGAPGVGVIQDTFTLKFCGDEKEGTLWSIVNSITGVAICSVKLSAWCTKCSL